MVLLWVLPISRAAADEPVSTAPKEVRIGVLAHRGEARALEAWTPTADYLSQEIPGHRFVVVPLTLDGTTAAVAAGELDFVLTNPAAYVRLEVGHGVTRMVTLRNRRPGGAYTQFGAVILTRADRADIRRIEDLKDKHFAAVKPAAFGGWLMARRRLEHAGLTPEELASVEFMGFPQDDIVLAIQRGDVDAGTVRTDILERMVAAGVVDRAEFRVLGAREDEGFPFAHSTRLYPEWAFASTRVSDPNLAQRVAVVLLSMSADHPASRAAKSGGWTVPLDYQPVHDLLKELHVAPYDAQPPMSVAELAQRYWYVLAGGLSFLVIGLTAAVLYVLGLYRSLKLSKAAMVREMKERRQAQENMWASEKLACLGRVAAGVAHEINSPLGAVYSNAQTLSRYVAELLPLLKVYRETASTLTGAAAQTVEAAERKAKLEYVDEDLPALIEDNEEGIDRMRRIVQDMRVVTRDRAGREPTDLRDLIDSNVNVVRTHAKPGARMTVHIAEDLPTIDVVPSQIGRVLMNLLVNAHDAIHEGGEVELRAWFARAANEVVVEVRDDGEGIADEHLGRIFDPFFTTKGVGKGTGLGLSLSYDVVRGHGGTLTVESEPGQGATFRFTLPLDAPDLEDDASTTPTEVDPWNASPKAAE